MRVILLLRQLIQQLQHPAHVRGIISKNKNRVILNSENRREIRKAGLRGGPVAGPSANGDDAVGQLRERLQRGCRLRSRDLLQLHDVDQERT